MNYPTDWDLRKYSKNTTYIRHGNDAFLAIVSSVPNEPTDLNSVSNNTIDQLEVTYGSIESNKSILSNVDSRILYYNMSDEIGQNRTVMEELALKNGKIYALYYMANPSVYSTYLPIIKNMLQSFKIIDMLPYEDATLGIKINYPSNWNKTSFVRDLVAGINFTSSSIKPLPNDNVSISISRIENIPPKSISEIVNQTIDKYKETLDDFSLLFNTSSDDKSNMMLFSYKDDILGTMGVLE